MGYAVSALLSNICICLRGNQTSYRFACARPEIEDYLQLYDNEELASTSDDESSIDDESIEDVDEGA